jgi:hypothetical protein
VVEALAAGARKLYVEMGIDMTTHTLLFRASTMIMSFDNAYLPTTCSTHVRVIFSNVLSFLIQGLWLLKHVQLSIVCPV